MAMIPFVKPVPLLVTMSPKLRQSQFCTPFDTQKPAVPAKKSVQEDYIICLEDGKKFKSLKRHLNVRYGLSPDEYRQKWGLPADYPMVAPSYAIARSALAKTMGLGRKKVETPPPEPAKRGRKKAAASA